MSYNLTKITPNLVVSDVSRSIAFYRDRLGFAVAFTVPEQAPFVFAAMQRGSLEIFLNAPEAAGNDYPALAGRALGGTMTLFIEVEGVGEAHDALAGSVPIVMPLKKQWYGMTEFAFADPDGYIITLAERTQEAAQGN
jgi:catechol 2,3-dioxygenase-like lactoylglutathione lyase family enzyme